MQVFDASSMILAWDNYPVEQFPPLWRWIASQIEAEVFAMAKVAYTEVEHKYPECAQWLKENDIPCIDATNDILQEAMRIKGLLGIQGDKYHPKGVDEKDIIIIATAIDIGAELISDEGKQPLMPKEAAKLKVPGVCGLNEVSVPCLNFIELIRRSKVVFS